MRTLRLLLVGVVVSLLGSTWVGAASAQDDEVLGPMGAGDFTATDTLIDSGSFDWVSGPDYTEAAAVTAVSDFQASDPRISGEATWMSTARFYPYGEEGGIDPAVWVAAVRIENAEGAWSGTMTGYHDRDEATREWNVLSGEGAYEGLTAVFRFVAETGYEGVIVPGGLPPYPEAAAAEASTADAPTVVATELLDLIFDGSIIPEEFVGVLFSRKAYPTDQEIVYGPGFIPPNTFIRHIESGTLGIRPRSDALVIRTGHSQDDAEVVAAGAETTLGPGDTFIQSDVPWDEYANEALGEMWTPGDDAVIISLAIREQSRCCAMSHQGMASRWYHTLTDDIQALSDGPLHFRVQRWELPAGQSMTYVADIVPTLWAVDAGTVEACPVEPPSPERDGCSTTRANSPMWSMSTSPGVEMVLTSTGEEPAVLYQLVVEPAGAA